MKKRSKSENKLARQNVENTFFKVMRNHGEKAIKSERKKQKTFDNVLKKRLKSNEVRVGQAIKSEERREKRNGCSTLLLHPRVLVWVGW